MLRPALAVVLLPLVACGGSAGDDGAANAQRCTGDVCAASGTERTVRLTSFDHATDALTAVDGSGAVSLVVNDATQPLAADPCADPSSAVGALITRWNGTQPMNPYAPVDVWEWQSPYHLVLVDLAKAGAEAAITVAPDLRTVETIQPVCPPAP